MRVIRTSGSVGGPDGDVRAYPTNLLYGHGPPLGRVAVEQAVRLVAANDGGKLPAEVGRVNQPKAQPLAAQRRMNVRRVTREQDAIPAVRVDQARAVCKRSSTSRTEVVY